MKKFFGVIFMLFGLAMTLGGVALLVNTNSIDNSFEGRIGSIFSDDYRSEIESRRVASFALMIIGTVFFIVGTVMLASKSGEQRRREAELIAFRRMEQLKSTKPILNNAGNIIANDPDKSNEEIVKQLERISKLFEEGKINENEFIQLKKKIIEG